MRVSVVIPTYNRVAMLNEALGSIRRQGAADVEVIVVDDGSTDGTPEALADRPDLVYLRIAHRGNVGAARNAGIARASGGLIAFLDSDDVWLPGKLARQVALLEGTALAGSSGNARVAAGVSSNDLYLPRLVKDRLVCFEDLLVENSVITSTVVMRADASHAVGGFGELPILRGIEDYDLWLRLTASHGPMAYLGEALASYRDQPESSVRGERTRVEEVLGLLVVMARVEALVAGDSSRRAAVVARSSSLVAELAFHQWAGIPTRLQRGVARMKARKRLPRFRFAERGATGWLTVAPRRKRGAGTADAYVDPRELSLPARSLGGVVVDTAVEWTPSEVGHVAASTHSWLAHGATLRLEGADRANISQWQRVVERAGFVRRRETERAIEFAPLR